MSAGLDLIRIIGDEFSGVIDATVETFLEVASQQSNAAAWGAVYTQAMSYLAMHMMAQNGLGSGSAHSGTGSHGGGVASVKVGDISVGFGYASSASGAVGATDADLLETSYGRRYLALRGSRSATGPSVTQLDT